MDSGEGLEVGEDEPTSAVEKTVFTQASQGNKELCLSHPSNCCRLGRSILSDGSLMQGREVNLTSLTFTSDGVLVIQATVKHQPFFYDNHMNVDNHCSIMHHHGVLRTESMGLNLSRIYEGTGT